MINKPIITVILLLGSIFQNVQAQKICETDIIFKNSTNAKGVFKAYYKTTDKPVTGRLYVDCDKWDIKKGYSDYKNGLLHGKDITYYDDGKLWVVSNYVKGKLNGTSKEYDKYGNLYFWGEFKNGDTLKIIKDTRKDYALNEQPLQYLPATIDTNTVKTSMNIDINTININLFNKTRECVFVDTANIFIQQKDSLLYISNICDTIKRYMCATGIVMARIIERDSVITLFYKRQPSIKYVEVNLLYTYRNDCITAVNRDRQYWTLDTAYANSIPLLIYRKIYIIK